jgi:hypothetical protein
MNVTVQVYEYDPSHGIQYEWDEKDFLSITIRSGTAHVLADKEGLRLLARILLTLAQDDVPAGAHVHIDDFAGAVQGSQELILERVSGSISNKVS